MSLARIPELLKFYGNEVIFLVGGDLLRNSAEIEKNCERYRDLVDNA
jgi:ribulose-bisphosphate carboxylase large chain